MTSVDLPAGAVILHEGGERLGLFLLLSGSVRVVKNHGRRLQKQLALLEAGAYFVESIATSSLLHDIGKVGVPDAVLHATRKLTPEETSVMQRHSEIGAATIRRAMASSPGVTFLAMGYDIALYHHEWVNGAGYPRGLAGDAIPLSARIMAIADVCDAFCSDRVYHKGLSHEDTKKKLIGGKGTQFDPRLVDLFLEQEYELLELSDLHRER